MNGAGLPVAPMSRSIARRNNGALPRFVSMLAVDGGTTFITSAESRAWHPRLQALLKWVLDPSTWEGRDRRDGPPTVSLPLPSIPKRQSKLPLPGLDGPERDVLDPRRLGWSTLAGAPRFEVHYNGGGRFFRLYVQDRVDVRFLKKRDADTGRVWWDVHAVLKAPEAYADGADAWVDRWLGWLGWLVHRDWPRTPGEIDHLWHLSCLQVNGDVVGLDIRGEDKWSFVGWRKNIEKGKQTAHEFMAHEEVEKAARGFTQTLYFGRSTSDTEVCIYRKSKQLEDAKGVDPASSFYSPVWRRNGWNGRDRITRIELRLRKKALRFYTKKEDGTRELLYDFRRPSTLRDPKAMRHLWQYVTQKRRLVCPVSAESRLTRSPVDPAWDAVVRLGGEIDYPEEMRQQSREVKKMARDERVAKDLKGMVQSAVSLATRSGARLRSYREVGAVLAKVGRDMMRDGQPAEFDHLARVRDVNELSEYASLASAFFSGQADAEFAAFEDAVGVPLERVDWARCSGDVAFGDDEGFAQSLAQSSAETVRAWTRVSLTVMPEHSPLLPPAWRAGVLAGLRHGLEGQGAPPEDLRLFDWLKNEVTRYGGRLPKAVDMQHEDENEEKQIHDLGDDDGFPQALAPCTAVQIREWMRLSLTAENREKAIEAGLPPAFRRGAILGFKDALEHVRPMAAAGGMDSLVGSIDTMLEFVKLTGVE